MVRSGAGTRPSRPAYLLITSPQGSANGEEEQTPDVHGGEAVGPLMGVEGSKVVYYLGRE